MPDLLIEAVALWKRFDAVEVLRGVSFALARGETLAVMGGSGSGKTVLLRLIAGLLRPDRGHVRVFGRSVERLSEEELLPIRRRLGYVFQSAALFDSLTVYENVAFPLHEHRRLPEREVRDRVLRALERVGLDGDVLRLLPAELSGGMRKRVGIARTLMMEPEVILYDEPTAGLDPTNARLVTDLLSQVGADLCDTAIVVTHELPVVSRVADRVAVLIDGQFAKIGPVDEVLRSDDRAVRAFLAGEAR